MGTILEQWYFLSKSFETGWQTGFADRAREVCV
jgi:hypothetical protein